MILIQRSGLYRTIVIHRLGQGLCTTNVIQRLDLHLYFIFTIVIQIQAIRPMSHDFNLNIKPKSYTIVIQISGSSFEQIVFQILSQSRIRLRFLTQAYSSRAFSLFQILLIFYFYLLPITICSFYSISVNKPFFFLVSISLTKELMLQ